MRSADDIIMYYEGQRQVTFSHAEIDSRRRIANADPQIAHLAGVSLRVAPIDESTISALWSPTRFDWVSHYRHFKGHPQRFEAALWVDGRVHAVAYGRASGGDDNLTIHYIERRMGEICPLKGVTSLLITDIADLYADILGKRWLRLKAPIPPAIPGYEALGFSHSKSIGSVRYMERKVGQ